MGRIIRDDCILPDESAVKAVSEVSELKPPKNLKQLETFVGNINYQHNSAANFTAVATPLNLLHKKKTLKIKQDADQRKTSEDLKVQVQRNLQYSL